jgi:hypothetical protein
MSNRLLSDSPYASIDMGMDDDGLKMMFQQVHPMPKPFGIALAPNDRLYNDSIIRQDEIALRVTNVLANVPYKDEKDVQVLKDLLLGPPTINAVLRCTYLHSLISLP